MTTARDSLGAAKDSIQVNIDFANEEPCLHNAGTLSLTRSAPLLRRTESPYEMTAEPCCLAGVASRRPPFTRDPMMHAIVRANSAISPC